MPKISIITPCYNSERFVARTIESVGRQTFQDWEHIIVDDGSIDGSVGVVESYLPHDQRLKLIRQSNGGVCSARNAGYAQCSKDSSYVLFLDADDCLDPEMLSVLVPYLDKNRQVGLVYCDYTFVDEDDRDLPTPRVPRHVPSLFGVRQLPDSVAQTPFVSVFSGAPVLASLSILRRSIYDMTPGWDEGFGQHHEELDLYLRVSLIAEVHFIPQQLYRYRRHPAQSSAQATGVHICGKFHIQAQKFDEKWRNPVGLTNEQRRMVSAAWRFQKGRLTSYVRFQAGTSSLREGKILQAMRHYAVALGRYTRSFLPQ